MNINTSLSELNTYNALVTDLVPNIYKYTDEVQTIGDVLGIVKVD